MSAIKIAVQQSQKSGRRKKCEAMSAEASPDSKCPICLDIFHNISYVNRCLHKFCFRCILEWSKNKAECPLCKQPFNSIYHSIKSDDDFQKYELKQRVENASFGYFEGVRFRYRTTLTGLHRQMRGRTSPPPDNGVMFEASTNPTQQQQDRYIRRMMMRLAAKRRAASEGRAVTNVAEQEMINFRRELYRRGERIRNVRDGGRSRDTSAEFYRRNPACLHRLIPWLKRELVVLYGAHGSLVNIVQHIIMSRITRYDMEDGAIQEELRPFLQGRTEHFLHEFISFAKSPFNMEAYDQHAVYDCPAPSSNEGSSSNSSVIAISEDEESSAVTDHPGDSASTLSHAVWDDETPGPSYSTTVEQGREEPLSVLDSDSDISSEEDRPEKSSSSQQMSSQNQSDTTQVDMKNEDCASSDIDDCVIVGFVKPTAERTPELVQLSSDSDESSSEDTKEFPHRPQHIRFTSCSPAASRSSDSSRAVRSEIVQTDHHHLMNLRENSSSPLSSRRETSNKSDGKGENRERHKSKERDHRRKKKKSKSGDRRSPVISHSSASSRSTERGHYSRGREFTKHDRSYGRRDSDHSYQSYSHYRRERDGSVTHYTQRQSYYYSSHRYADLYLRSRSRSCSRDSRQRDRRHSRSRTYSSSCSPSANRESHHDKPGGKRKYKTRHLEEPCKKGHSSPNREGDSTPPTKHKKKSKDKHHKKSKEMPRKTSDSGSAEFVGEEKAHSKHHHKKKKKHKKKSKRHKSNEHKERGSPAVITIDSDSDSSANGMKRENLFSNSTDDQVDHLSLD